jgi:ABC-type Zn uptake system ZnuABC Zn-binding protein ZnuA
MKMKKSWYLICLLLIVVITIGWSLSKKADIDVANTSKLRITVSMPLLRNLAEEIGGELQS